MSQAAFGMLFKKELATSLRIINEYLGHMAQLTPRRRCGWRRTTNTYTVPTQTTFVNLTLEAWLNKLADLKKLEELHIPNMEHQVTEEQEVEWMV
ncbi:hypothetical protein BG000_001134 [Podila horticola]|nr:hypothetical protein BG000_001134 [Podila horticola]